MHRQSGDYDAMWTGVYGDMERLGPVHRHMNRIVRRIVLRLEYEGVLDVGCGPGHNLQLLGQGRKLQRMVGLDVSEVALSQAVRDWPTAEFHHLDIQEGSLDGRWDLVFCSLVLEHLADDEGALRNMRAMAGKHVLVTTIAGDFDRYKRWDVQMGHVRNYAVGELERKMEDAGLHVEESVYWGFPFYSPLARSLQNRMTATSKLGFASRLMAAVMYSIYFLNLSRRGDLLVVLASV